MRQPGFASAHLFGAVCPERGEAVALVLPEVSTAAMGVFLAGLSRAVPAGTRAALVLDGAGWHVSEELARAGEPDPDPPAPLQPRACLRIGDAKYETLNFKEIALTSRS